MENRRLCPGCGHRVNLDEFNYESSRKEVSRLCRGCRNAKRARKRPPTTKRHRKAVEALRRRIMGNE